MQSHEPIQKILCQIQVCPDDVTIQKRDVPKGAYAESVITAKEEFRVGNLFEVVLSQVFRDKLNVKPSHCVPETLPT